MLVLVVEMFGGNKRYTKIGIRKMPDSVFVRF